MSQGAKAYIKGGRKRTMCQDETLVIHFETMPSRALLYYSTLALFFGIQAVHAHFQMIHPPATRGFDESKEPLAPCGGFDTPSDDRISMPHSSFMTIDSGHVSYSYVIKALFNDNPSADDFNAANLHQLTDGTRSYPQAACLPFEFNSDVQDGTKATLQIVYNGGDGLLYQVNRPDYQNQTETWHSLQSAYSAST